MPYINEELGINDPNMETVSGSSGSNPRPMVEMTGNTVKMYKNGKIKDVDVNQTSAFENAGYSFGDIPKTNISSTVTPKQQNIDNVKTQKNAGTSGTSGTGQDSNIPINSETQVFIDQAKFYENQYIKMQEQFDNYTADIAKIDAENNPLIQDIKDTFARRISEMEQTNQAMQGQTALAGVRSGLSRYSAQTQQGLVSKELQKGIDRISSLESDKLNAISMAKQALKDDAKDKWESFNTYMTNASTAYNNKVQAVKDLHQYLRDEEDRASNKKLKDLQIQQLEQEMLNTNLDMYSSSMLSYDESGNLMMPSQEELQLIADDLGINVNILVGSIRNKYNELSKLNQEDQLRELNIMKAAADLEDRNKTELIKNYEYAVDNNNFTGSIFDFQKQFEASKKITDSIVDYSDLDPLDQLKARNLAVEIFGKKEGSKVENATLIAGLMQKGMTIDNIRDQLKYSTQSEEFSGALRGAAESIGYNLTADKRENLFDSIDRLLDEGKSGQILDLIKKAAVDGVGTEEAKQIRGKDRTIEFMEEIRQDLADYEAKGGDTNIFTGNIEKLAGKVGTVKDPELRTIATKIATAVQQYRRSMSGVAFSVPESKEYQAIFPNIDKTKEFNSSVLDALLGTFKGDLEYFYKNQIGEDNYYELFEKPKEAIKYNDINSFLEKSTKEEIKELIDLQNAFPDLSDEDLFNEFKASKGFSSVGNDTNEVVKISQAIGQFESGGNYKAIGPEVTSGMYKGDKALGKYQIMGKNIPSWSKEALGYEITKEQFLNSPELQDKIAQYKMNQSLQKYGTVEDVASVWFSGRPVAQAGNASDVLGTTVPQYIKNVINNYNKII